MQKDAKFPRSRSKKFSVTQEKNGRRLGSLPRNDKKIFPQDPTQEKIFQGHCAPHWQKFPKWGPRVNAPQGGKNHACLQGLEKLKRRFEI